MTLREMNDGAEIPEIGLGVFKVPAPDTERVVSDALAAGYRLIDTASMYGNEEEVGRAVVASGLQRSEVHVTTKVWNDDQGATHTRAACERSLAALGLDFVDLYLIHWPSPARGLYVETWETLVALRSEGLVRSIGVCNFLPEHVSRIVDATGVTPVVNQVELHPWLPQRRLRRFNEEQGIITEAWAPLGRARFLHDPALRAIAKRLERTPAQVILRWHLQLGDLPIPKTVRAARMAENLAVFDFTLSDEDMGGIARLDAESRTGPNPARFG